MTPRDFCEIEHTGGVVTVLFGATGYQLRIQHSSPTAAAMFPVWVRLDGEPVALAPISGVFGGDDGGPPAANCVQAWILSDTEGRFGHKCPECNQYWRSGPFVAICPYCGLQSDAVTFLSPAQLGFLAKYCELFREAWETNKSPLVIDFDKVADWVLDGAPTLAEFFAEKTQQTRFTCTACDHWHDIIGRFGYCAVCGTRNDIEVFTREIVPGIREQLKQGVLPSDCLRTAFSAFDSCVAKYVAEMRKFIPMTPHRKGLLMGTFVNFKQVRDRLREVVDVDIGRGISESDFAAVRLASFRRHVYEHAGGEVDQKYLDDSGDTTVQLRQHIREDPDAIHNLLTTLCAAARNLHVGFHQILEPIPEPIRAFKDKQERVKSWNNNR